MDRGSVSTLHLFPQPESEGTNVQTQKQLETFILEFRLDNIFVYRYGAIPLLIVQPIADMCVAEINCARMRSYKDITATSISAT